MTLDIYRTTHFSASLACEDAAGAAFDLTGWSVEAQVRRKFGSTALVCDLSAEITNEAGGLITLTLTAGQTTALTDGQYAWDAVLTTPGGLRQPPLISGDCIVRTPLSRPD